MNAIVSVTSDWGIGLQGRLLVRNREDMRFFKEQTMGGTVICGQTTFESFPGGALPGRRNVVISDDEAYVAPGAEVVHGLEEALAAVAHAEPDSVWLIGGQSIYRQLIDQCAKAYVTKNDVVLEADAFFPDLDADPSWHLSQTLGSGTTEAGINFAFCVYTHDAQKC